MSLRLVLVSVLSLIAATTFAEDGRTTTTQKAAEAAKSSGKTGSGNIDQGKALDKLDREERDKYAPRTPSPSQSPSDNADNTAGGVVKKLDDRAQQQKK